MTTLPVTPAKAGVPLLAGGRRSGIPAFAGMTMWVVAALLLLLAAPASAQTFPELTGRVVDQAELLRPEQELDLSSKSAALEAQTGRQLVIATVNSLEGRRIEDYSYQLGRHWKIGDEKRDDGVVMVVAPNEKKVWIATGYGARVFLTDAVTSVIVRESILPRFKAGDMAGGITAGADQIIKVMSLTPQEAQRQAGAAERREKERDKAGSGLLPVAFWLMIAVFVLLSMFRRSAGKRYRRRRGGGVDPWVVLWGLSELSQASRRGRGGWGGGGGFGGFGGGGGGFGGFSGGGGSFGGGGAGGSW